MAVNLPDRRERIWMTYREGLIAQAAAAMQSAGKLVEMPVLNVLDEDSLKEIIDYYGSPTAQPARHPNGPHGGNH